VLELHDLIDSVELEQYVDKMIASRNPNAILDIHLFNGGKKARGMRRRWD
jgi:hypothetical protein